MEGNSGVWHKTTLQLAQEEQKKYQTIQAQGQKRSYPEESEGHGGQPFQTGKRAARDFQRASAFSKQPARLTASRIRAVDPSVEGGPSEYSQRQAFPSTPGSTLDPLLSLSHPVYGLPDQLVVNLAALGIKTIYPWQKQCLLGPGLLRGEKNLVYCAPTGGGKSLVADILMLKRVVRSRSAKALLVLPYVALVQEKVRWLRNIVQGLPRTETDGQCPTDEPRLWRRRADADTIRVVGIFGGSKLKATWADFDIGVCTIEKANLLVNTAIHDCSIADLEVVVLDELHMIDDDYRGYLLELTATKLLCLDHTVQIVGMSATLANAELLSSWLKGHHYETHYRPVPIREHIVFENNVFSTEATAVLRAVADPKMPQNQVAPLRKIDLSSHKELQDPVLNAVVALAHETAQAGFGVLIFAGSRAGCENDALLLSRAMSSTSEIPDDILETRSGLLNDLRSLPTGLDPKLEQTVPYGVSFHHAGLTTEERDLIANAYDSGVLKICVATCSLAAGINLPARRVILHNARMGRDLVGPSMLRQMRGRAGRKGKDEIGETYLCCRQQDLDDVIELMDADLPQIHSSLTTDKHRIQRAILEIVAVKLATSRGSVDDYIRNTLLHLSAEPGEILAHVNSSMSDLQSMGFISVDQYQNYQATQLGQAIVISGLDPDEGVFLHNELKRALRAFVMDGEMHILYTFTPLHDTLAVINWRVFWNEIEALDDSGIRVLRFLGLKPTVIEKMLHGGVLKNGTVQEKEIAWVYHRFYLALQLRDICNEMPIHQVARKYDVPRGAVQTLGQTCQGFAAGIIKFCEHMGWGIMAAALDHFSDRLRAGAKSDLLALAKITFVKSRTARVFWDNGFKTVAAVANTDPSELVPVLMQAQPNKVRLGGKDDTKYKEKLLAKARVITDSATRIWQIQMQQDSYYEE